MNLFGVRVDEHTLDEALDLVAKAVGGYRRRPRQKLTHLGGQAFFIVTPNPEQIVQAQGDKEFRTALNSADLAIPDGVGIVIALRILNTKYHAKGQAGKILDTKPQRVSGVELFEKLVVKASSRGWKVMLVGGRGETAANAADKLRMENGKLKIIGIEGISNVKNPDKKEEKRLIAQIDEYKPELLFVGFGAPWQEKWVYRNLKLKMKNSKLPKIRTKVVMVVGGAFDQIVDASLRPPKWLDGVGLGWFYRLLRQPWRIGRQLRLVRFGWMVLRSKIKRSDL